MRQAIKSSGISPICAPVGSAPGPSRIAPGGRFVAVPVLTVLGWVKVELKVALTPWAWCADEVVAVNGGLLAKTVMNWGAAEASDDEESLVLE